VQINGVEIEDTFAEAFGMIGSRVLITAINEKWAMTAATSMTGFGTSVIACGCETGIERMVPPEETPDGRPGVNVLIFAMSENSLSDQMVRRIGQCVMTSPTSACFDALEEGKEVLVGKKLRFFGDGFQVPKVIGGRRVWRIPVMEGEFTIDEKFHVKPAVGGGNFLILGRDVSCVLKATERAVEAISKVRGVIAPFPGGVVRSGSKVGSKYKFLRASTNVAYCPTIRPLVQTSLPQGVNSVMEIVIDGLDEGCVSDAMREGIKGACSVDGILRISAGNYGGKLGKFLFHLRRIMEAEK
jgi:formylmethanofuran--tetrahydromethanopterin N-formyltransferase